MVTHVTMETHLGIYISNCYVVQVSFGNTRPMNNGPPGSDTPIELPHLHGLVSGQPAGSKVTPGDCYQSEGVRLCGTHLALAAWMPSDLGRAYSRSPDSMCWYDPLMIE